MLPFTPLALVRRTPILSGQPSAFAFLALRLGDFGVDRNAVLVPHKPISTSFLTSEQSFHAERSFMSFDTRKCPYSIRRLAFTGGTPVPRRCSKRR